MSIQAALGFARAIDPADAGSKASYLAMRTLGSSQPVAALVITSHDYPLTQVAAGAGLVLGDIPLFGFSTSSLLGPNGISERGVAVALLAGAGIQARAGWWPGFGEDPRQPLAAMIKNLLPGSPAPGPLFIAADGFNGDPAILCSHLPDLPDISGCLAGGELLSARTWQLGGKLSGPGGLAALKLDGLQAGQGIGHGWAAVGAYAHVTRSRGLWLRSLDGAPAAEAYARLFGVPAREWAFPPYHTLVRLYPLQIEATPTAEASPALLPGEDPPTRPSGSLVLRAPLRAEADGSLRMNTAIPEGATAHFTIGSIDLALGAARQAAATALQSLQGARPVLALLWVDAAWQTLLQAQPGAELDAVRAVIGPDVPVTGAYTYGQFTSKSGLLNNHILVTLLGEA